MILYNLLLPENRSKTIHKENCLRRRRELLGACSTKTFPQGTLFNGGHISFHFYLRISSPGAPFLFILFHLPHPLSLSLDAHFLPAKEAYVRYILMNYSEHGSVQWRPTTSTRSDAVFSKPCRCSEILFWNVRHTYVCVLSWELFNGMWLHLQLHYRRNSCCYFILYFRLQVYRRVVNCRTQHTNSHRISSCIGCGNKTKVLQEFSKITFSILNPQ